MQARLLRAEDLGSGLSYGIIKGGGSRGEGARKPRGTLGKLREYRGVMGITRLPTPLDHPPLKDILVKA